jgi:hypothetical protein
MTNWLETVLLAWARWLSLRYSCAAFMSRLGYLAAGYSFAPPRLLREEHRPRAIWGGKQRWLTRVMEEIFGATPTPTPAPVAPPKCSDTRYCWMHGHPCSCCGGSDTACPTGTNRGSTWTYCCGGRTRSFRDCCGNVTCPSSCVWCDNSTQPNWCYGAGSMNYVCTLSEDLGAC